MTTTQSRSLCLSLELHSEGERISGRLGDDQGNDWGFACWLDLLTLIERVHAGAKSGAPNHNRARAARGERSSTQ
jgi:hypothetical protein